MIRDSKIHPTHKLDRGRLTARTIDGTRYPCKIYECVYCGAEKIEIPNKIIIPEMLYEKCYYTEMIEKENQWEWKKGKRPDDLTEQRFGKLVAIKIVEKEGRTGIWWLCECDCGGEKIVSAYNLKNSKTKSCGCLRAEHCRKMLIDLTGKRFGKLIVLRRVPAPAKDKSRRPYWLCQCDCGNTKVVCSINLKIGGTRSCGCLRKGKHKKRSAHG